MKFSSHCNYVVKGLFVNDTADFQLSALGSLIHAMVEQECGKNNFQVTIKQLISSQCKTSGEIIRGVGYQLVTVRLPSVSVGRVAILVSNHSVVLDSFPVDN